MNSNVNLNRRRAERLSRVEQDLRQGRPVLDLWFDQLYPPEVRKYSSVHWTPVAVARRAAELLVEDSRTRVLDVGSGCGKFCLVGAMATPGQFVGVEQRAYLVEAARAGASRWSVGRARFHHGSIAEIDWEDFEAFYLFNPFYEHRHPTVQLDQTIPFSEGRFVRYVRFVQTRLREARLGTRVVTYHGFGGEIPAGYERRAREPAGTSVLELWVKVAEPRLRYPRESMDM